MLKRLSAKVAADMNRPAGVLMLAVWFALLTGYIEAAVHLFRYHVLDRMVWTTPQIIWVAPIAYVVLFMPLALLLYAVLRWRRSLVGSPLPVGVLAFPMALVASVMIIGTRIHWLAHVVLALGAALQIARMAGSRRERFSQLVARGTPVLIALTAILAVVYPAGRIAHERIAVARLGQPASDAPNVVLIIWDTVRRGNVSLYGYPRETTPNLERWASRAVVFNRAQSTAPWTLSSHASMFTGRLTQELSPDWDQGLDGTYPTIAEALNQRGYYTAAFVANLIAAQHDSGLNRGFLRYEDFELGGTSFFLSTLVGQRIARPKPFNRGPIRYYPMKIAPDVTQDFLDWLPKAEGRPFFAFLNYIDAHHGFPAPEDLKRKFGTKGRMNKYDAAIGSLDRQLDRLLSELEQRGLRRNTVVILASDHGEQFGEKGLFQHGNSLYQPAMTVPLVIWLPGDENAGKRVDQPVSLRDLARTVLEVTGVSPDAQFGGHSLARYWNAVSPSAADTVIGGLQARIGTPNHEPNSKGDMNAVYTTRHSYILNGDGTEELFDLFSDPTESVNLAKDPAHAMDLSAFQSYLRKQVPENWLSSLNTTNKRRLGAAGGAEELAAH